MLREGHLPPEGTVRVEFVDCFRFDYTSSPATRPVAKSGPRSSLPWNEDHLLALVGLQATDVADA